MKKRSTIIPAVLLAAVLLITACKPTDPFAAPSGGGIPTVVPQSIAEQAAPGVDEKGLTFATADGECTVSWQWQGNPPFGQTVVLEKGTHPMLYIHQFLQTCQRIGCAGTCDDGAVAIAVLDWIGEHEGWLDVRGSEPGQRWRPPGGGDFQPGFTFTYPQKEVWEEKILEVLCGMPGPVATPTQPPTATSTPSLPPTPAPVPGAVTQLDTKVVKKGDAFEISWQPLPLVMAQRAGEPAITYLLFGYTTGDETEGHFVDHITEPVISEDGWFHSTFYPSPGEIAWRIVAQKGDTVIAESAGWVMLEEGRGGYLPDQTGASSVRVDYIVTLIVSGALAAIFLILGATRFSLMGDRMDPIWLIVGVILGFWCLYTLFHFLGVIKGPALLIPIHLIL